MAPPIVLQRCTIYMVVISCGMYSVQGCAKKRRDGASQPNLQLFQLFLALDKAPRLSFRIERILLSDQSRICPNHMIRIQISLAHHSPSPSERAGLDLVTCKDLRLNGWLVVERRTRRRGNDDELPRCSPSKRTISSTCNLPVLVLPILPQTPLFSSRLQSPVPDIGKRYQLRFSNWCNAQHYSLDRFSASLRSKWVGETD